MNRLKVLDVTLRDGGCVNNFNFGTAYMNKILHSLEAAQVDIIEVGYIDEKKGSIKGRTQYLSEKCIETSLNLEKKQDISYVAMIDYGKFDIDNLQNRNVSGIDGIRLAFHKKNRFEAIDLGKKIIEKGYDFYVQPMITLRYSDAELLELIQYVNDNIPTANAFYIVDSFGEMRPNDMCRIMNLVDHNLNLDISIGFHSHNNLQLSYSNAISLLQFATNREVIIDSSIMGMGKGAGNLNTELLLEHLNLYYGKTYSISPLLEVIDKVVNQLHSEFYWGYAIEYHLSSVNHCTPSYASYFYNKHMLPIDQVGELLSLIEDNKKISFDAVYAENLYREYNQNKTVNDLDTINELKNIFSGKSILLIAPGKSTKSKKKDIEKFIHENEVITIGLNINWKFDYVITTREEMYREFVNAGVRVITTSNVAKAGRGNVMIVDYGRWIDVKEETHDSSAVIIMNILKECNVNNIYLAGFDGFSMNINDNYCDPYLRHPVSEEQATKRNHYYKNFINKIKEEGINIEFVTASKYE